MSLLPESLLKADLERTGTILLDAGVGASTCTSSSLLFSDPITILRADQTEDIRSIFAAVDAWIQKGKWVAGFVAYEAGFAFVNQGLTKPLAQPLIWFGVYEAPAHVSVDTLDEVVGISSAALRGSTFFPEKTTYLPALAAIKEHIYEGDVYQINYTGHIDFQTEESAIDLFVALRHRQKASYGALLNLGDQQIISLSPELFFEREGTMIHARPMKGTIHRGLTAAEDTALQQQLASDEKNRAENLMIVDLMRNDLSRICEPGTVRTPRLFTIEPYPTLIQMTSSVEGRLKPETAYAAIFEALFPCGSITGAPKIRAMEIIDTLEHEARGVYCGAIGYIGPHDRAMFNVAIRTLTLQDGHGRMGVGSGIVWDSDPEAEYDECLLKAQFLQMSSVSEEPFALIETMLWEGEIALLAYHLDRLEQSASYFGRLMDREEIEHAIQAACLDLGRRTKVRLLLHPDGTYTLTTSTLLAPSAHLRKLCISENRIDSKNPFFYHKTTRRQLYEQAYRQAQQDGYDEVLFMNERGELAEGSRTNLFLRFGDRLYTPPLTSGVLPGVYRRYVLESFPNVEERILLLNDLLQADALYLTNAVQGWVEAVWSPTTELADVG